MYDAWYANSQNATRFWNDIINCYGYTILYIYCLKIAGPSSTFFIVTFSLPINLPIAPEEALYRGFAILVGGILATMMVLITIVFSKTKLKNKQFKMILNSYLSCYTLIMINLHFTSSKKQRWIILKHLINY